MRPPRVARRLLAALLPASEREFVLGDLDEQFARWAQEGGPLRAALRYHLEAARSIAPMLTYPGRWRGFTMVGMAQDLRGAMRVFRRSPGFSTVVVATLALGVGGASAVYSVVRGVLLRPLPFEDPDRVVMLWGRSLEYPRAPLTVGDHNVLAREVEAFESVAASWTSHALILGEGQGEQVSVGWVTAGYFGLLGIRPALGRDLVPVDERAILLTHDLWARRYGSDPAVIGRTIDLGGDAFEVVGVLPPGRDGNLTSFGGGRSGHQVWRLQPTEWMQGDDRSVGWLRSTARLAAGVTLERAQAEVDGLMTRVNATVTNRDGGEDLMVRLIPVRADLVGGVSRTLWILFGAVVTVLLVAATNVAHLVLARGEVRSGEVAVRSALGGTRGRLVRQLLMESGVLALAGGLLGVVLASVGIDALVALAPPSVPRLDEVGLDGSVLAFGLAATAAAALMFGVLPALRATRVDLSRSLGDRTATATRQRQRLSRGLVVAEVALSLALVTSTGLLLRSLSSLHATDLGFEKAGVLTFAVELPAWGKTDEEAAATMALALDRVGSVPGVRAAGFTNRVPLGGGLFTGALRTEEMVAADVDAPKASVRFVTSGYFEAMGAPVLAGRSFLPEDGLDRVVIDRIAAERAWPGESAIGRTVEITAIGQEPTLAEVVGVVASMKHHGVREDAEQTVYLPMLAAAAQQNFRYMAVRVDGDPEAYVEPLRRSARAVHPDAVLARIRTMESLVDDDVATTRFASVLLSTFGIVALLLAAIGLHGVMAFTVRRQAREIGIRVVLGAEHRRLLRASVGAGARLVAAGILVGTLLSIGIGRALGSVLYGVEPGDAVTLVTSAAVMMAVGLVGAYLPARLILGVDPAVTLRES